MIPTTILDVDAFYGEGVSVCRLERLHARVIDAELKALTWVADSDGVFNAVPQVLREGMAEQVLPADQLQRERFLGAQVLDRIPLVLREELANVLLGPYTQPWQSLYDFHVLRADIWDGAEDCDWHWDGADGSDVNVLMYFSDSINWDDRQGGALEIGRRCFNGSSDLVGAEGSEVKRLHAISPCFGTLCFVNNMNPALVHRPRPLNSSVSRCVFNASVKLVLKTDMASQSSVVFCNE